MVQRKREHGRLIDVLVAQGVAPEDVAARYREQLFGLLLVASENLDTVRDRLARPSLKQNDRRVMIGALDGSQAALAALLDVVASRLT